MLIRMNFYFLYKKQKVIIIAVEGFLIHLVFQVLMTLEPGIEYLAQWAL